MGTTCRAVLLLKHEHFETLSNKMKDWGDLDPICNAEDISLVRNLHAVKIEWFNIGYSQLIENWVFDIEDNAPVPLTIVDFCNYIDTDDFSLIYITEEDETGELGELGYEFVKPLVYTENTLSLVVNYDDMDEDRFDPSRIYVFFK